MGAIIDGARLIEEIYGWKGSTFLYRQHSLYLVPPGLIEVFLAILSFLVSCCMDWSSAPRHDLRDYRFWRHPKELQLQRHHGRRCEVYYSFSKALQVYLL